MDRALDYLQKEEAYLKQKDKEQVDKLLYNNENEEMQEELSK